MRLYLVSYFALSGETNLPGSSKFKKFHDEFDSSLHGAKLNLPNGVYRSREKIPEPQVKTKLCKFQIGGPISRIGCYLFYLLRRKRLKALLSVILMDFVERPFMV